MNKFIEKCLPYLRSRLNDLSGQVFIEDDLKNYIRISISANNPFIDDNDIQSSDRVFKIALDNIISHAVYQALFAHSLKEKEREHTEFLLQASKVEYETWRDRKAAEERDNVRY